MAICSETVRMGTSHGPDGTRGAGPFVRARPRRGVWCFNSAPGPEIPVLRGVQSKFGLRSSNSNRAPDSSYARAAGWVALAGGFSGPCAGCLGAVAGGRLAGADLFLTAPHELG